DGSTAWLLSDADVMTLHHGDEASGLGWHAPVYGALMTAFAARASRAAAAPFDVITWIGTSATPPQLERVRTRDGVVAARVTTGDRAAMFLLRSDRQSTRDADDIEGIGYATDARVFHYSTDAQGIRAIDLVDAAYARAADGDAISVRSDPPISDLHLAIDDHVL